MSLSANTVWEVRTTGNDNNGGGFVTGSGGTDYSQQNAAQLALTDLASNGAGTTITSAVGGFTAAMIGNIMRIYAAGAGFTTGWYQITGFTNGNTITIDRSAGANATGGSGNVGGAKASVDVNVWGMQLVPGNKVYLKNGTYTITSTWNSATGSDALPIEWEGYNIARGDLPTGATRPFITNPSGFQFAMGWYNNISSIIFSTVDNTGYQIGYVTVAKDCKFISTSAVSTAGACWVGQQCRFIRCEVTAPLCRGLTSFNDVYLQGCYIHDCVIGIRLASNPTVIEDTVFKNCQTGIYTNSSNFKIINNTFYGAQTPTGIGIDFGGNGAHLVANNIFYGLTTAVTSSVNQKSVFMMNNNFFNNTTNRVNVDVGVGDIALNPAFVDAPNGNFAVGPNMKAMGAPSVFNAALSTTSYVDIGAAQRQEPSADYPVVGNVRNGIVYNNGGSVGTLALPAPADVKNTIQYGAGGNEFTGSYVPAPLVTPSLGAVNFDTKLLDDAKFAFLNSSEFAEVITYTPYGGSAKFINSIIVRERLESKGPDHTISLNRGAEIYIANDAALGVTSINKNNDKVSLPLQVGRSPVIWTVVEILQHDDAMWHLRVIK